MTITTTTSYAVSVGIADIRRDPDPTAELVTQALMNTPASGAESDGEWTHVILSDYSGWMRTNQLEEPVFCKHVLPDAPKGHHYTSIGLPALKCSDAPKGRQEHSQTLPLVAVVNCVYTALYTKAQGDDAHQTLYLSTVLPLVDTSHAERVQVALPGEKEGWLRRSDIAIRQNTCAYPCTPISVVTDYARAFLGRDYLWGGTSWEGIDCSGLVQLCYRMGGYILPRDGDQQHDFLPHSVKRSAMQEGDLIFFGSAQITHVALALNHEQYIHAEGQNYDHVVINSFNPAAENYYPRLDEIVWDIKRVVV